MPTPDQAQRATPDSRAASGDPGDETARRYRFQHAWAAIACCMVLDDTLDVVEILCEQHEDILIKHADGTFTGQQVKTRNSDQPLWKATDAAFKTSCARFAKLESEFPGQFRECQFLTGHPLHAASSSAGIEFVLRSIAEASSVVALPPTLRRWVRQIATEAAVAEETAFAAIKRTSANGDLPKLQDVLMRLVNTLTQFWAEAKHCTHGIVVMAAESLVEACAQASSLGHEQLLPGYLRGKALEAAQLARLEGKRITSEKILRCLEDGRAKTATLAGNPLTRVEPGAGSSALLVAKLDAGGFSAVSLDSAKDLRDKADYLGIQWTQKFGRDEGLERYNHVLTTTHNVAARAFEVAKSPDAKFGPAMREELRKKLLERRAAGAELYDCTDEHLEGLAYSLTAQCRVVWSNDRPWEAS